LLDRSPSVTAQCDVVLDTLLLVVTTSIYSYTAFPVAGPRAWWKVLPLPPLHFSFSTIAWSPVSWSCCPHSTRADGAV